MRKYIQASLGAFAVLALLLPALAAAQESAPGRRFGASVAVGVAGAPLGQLAESYGTRAIPGLELDIRAVRRAATGHEFSIGVLTDRYRMDHTIDLNTHSLFEHTSVGVVAGRSWFEEVGDVPMRFGLDLGWRRFSTSSSRPDFYTSDLAVSDVRGDAALLAVTYGVELPSGAMTVMPRLRLETSYPDFGGGDGYSALHRDRSLGFRASVGVELKSIAPGGH